MIASAGADREGSSYNVNADTAAGKVAAALRAYKAIFLTDVEGWLADPDDPGSLISRATTDRGRARRSPGIEGGMRPKLAACVEAISGGVQSAHIIDGRRPHSLLLELFTGRASARWSRREAVSELQALDERWVMPTYARAPVEFVRGEGARLWDSDGKRVPRLLRRALGPQRRPLPSPNRRGDPRAGGAG